MSLCLEAVRHLCKCRSGPNGTRLAVRSSSPTGTAAAASADQWALLRSVLADCWIHSYEVLSFEDAGKDFARHFVSCAQRRSLWRVLPDETIDF